MKCFGRFCSSDHFYFQCAVCFSFTFSFLVVAKVVECESCKCDSGVAVSQ